MASCQILLNYPLNFCSNNRNLPQFLLQHQPFGCISIISTYLAQQYLWWTSGMEINLCVGWNWMIYDHNKQYMGFFIFFDKFISCQNIRILVFRRHASSVLVLRLYHDLSMYLRCLIIQWKIFIVMLCERERIMQEFVSLDSVEDDDEGENTMKAIDSCGIPKKTRSNTGRESHGRQTS